MFKKNPNRPPITLLLRKVPNGYKYYPNETQSLFIVRKIVRSASKSKNIEIFEGKRNNKSLENICIDDINAAQIQSVQTDEEDNLPQVTRPAMSEWFSVENIHQIEMDAFPEFFLPSEFNSKLNFQSKNPQLYKFIRNSMIQMWMLNTKKYVSASLCRKTIAGDVSAIMRIHAFLEHWGLINFFGKEPQIMKTIVESAPIKPDCFVCSAKEVIMYICEVEDITFQLCEDCFMNERYPLCLVDEDWKRVFAENHAPSKLMDENQVLRVLNILGNNNSSETDVWNAVKTEFPTFSKEEIIMNFLKIPTRLSLNTSIFENGEDTLNNIASPQPEITSFLEDSQNFMQTAIAMWYYAYKQDPNKPEWKTILDRIAQMKERLTEEQNIKIKNMLKLIIDHMFEKVEARCLIVEEYDKYVRSEEEQLETVAMGLIADNLMRPIIEDQLVDFEQPESSRLEIVESSLHSNQSNESKSEQICHISL